jgi:hypothetical protein
MSAPVLESIFNTADFQGARKLFTTGPAPASPICELAKTDLPRAIRIATEAIEHHGSALIEGYVGYELTDMISDSPELAMAVVESIAQAPKERGAPNIAARGHLSALAGSGARDAAKRTFDVATLMLAEANCHIWMGMDRIIVPLIQIDNDRGFDLATAIVNNPASDSLSLTSLIGGLDQMAEIDAAKTEILKNAINEKAGYDFCAEIQARIAQQSQGALPPADKKDLD